MARPGAGRQARSGTLEPPGSVETLEHPADADVHDHLVGFYDSDAFLVDAVVDFLTPAFTAAEGMLVIATAEHRAGLRAALAADPMARNVEPGRLVMLDVDEVRAQVIVDGAPDPARFRSLVGATVDQLAPAGGHVRIFGEMVARLWGDGQIAAALAVEDLWNEVALTRPFSLFCAYPLAVFGGEDSAAEFLTVCQRHSAVTNESYSDPWDRTADGRRVVVLQREPVRQHDEVIDVR